MEVKNRIVFLFRENIPEEIPEKILSDERCYFIHEAPSFPEGILPEGRSASFEGIAELNGMMNSVWNQIEWLKRLGGIPLKDGKSFKELYKHRELPLWYFAELSMHYPKRLLRIITLLDIFDLICRKHSVDEIILINPALDPCRVITKAAAIKDIPLSHINGRKSYPFKARLKKFFRGFSPAIAGRFYICKQLLSVIYIFIIKPFASGRIKPFIYNGRGEPQPDKKKICVVSHGSYWRKAPAYYTGASRELDMYWDRLIDELNSETGVKNSAVTVLGVGPRTIHKRRRAFTKLREFFLPLGERPSYVPVKWFSTFGTWARTRRGAREILKSHREFLKNPELADSIVYRGVNFYDEFYIDLKEMFILMLPWSIKIIEQSLSAFERLKPDVVCLYAEAGGYGRALAYAAKLLRINTIAIQHGLIFPHNYTYVHAQDEIKGKAGAPYPFTDRFLLYDGFVKKILEKYGNYPPRTLVVTGGHKMDNLLALKKTIDPKEKKKDLGFNERDKFAVIASRFSEIGSAFPAIVKAVEEIPRLHLIVKPHQAELAKYYTDITTGLGARKVTVVSNKENLFELMLASDLLITVNSLAALEAIVLEKPVMVVNLPNHLSVYVDAGIAVGVKSHGDILPALKKMFVESPQELLKRQAEFSKKHAFMTDGHSGERIKAEIYAACHKNTQ